MGQNCSVGKQLDMSNTTITVNESLHSESKTAFSTKLQFSAISEHSPLNTPQSIEDWLMLLRPDSHANHSAQPEISEQGKTYEICGPLPYASLNQSNLNTHYWKMSQGCLEGMGISEQYSATWQKQGLMRNGAVYQQPPLEPHTNENASGSLLPTPRAGDYKGATSATAAAQARARGFSPNLPELIAEEANGGRLNPLWVEWLMGFPIGASDLKPLEMHKYQLWRQKHGKV